ncbi:MAG TPA: hypothetical protein VJH03_16315 [Blastocatellia bacterium]|nr:hypothetical protein [Blastocatellia bacterium]
MRITVLLCMAIFTVSGWSQTDRRLERREMIGVATPIRALTTPVGSSAQFEPMPPLPYHKLSFEPVSSSEFVVIGRVGRPRGIHQRLREGERLELDLGKVKGGVLFTFEVEKLLCTKADFTRGASRADTPLDKFRIFKTSDQRLEMREFYSQNQRYLMFVKRIPNSEELPTLYNLDEGETYYEAFEGVRGLIPLGEKAPPLVARLEQFCRAVRPVDPRTKLRLLKRLIASSDPELRQTAQEAARVIQKAMRR